MQSGPLNEQCTRRCPSQRVQDDAHADTYAGLRSITRSTSCCLPDAPSRSDELAPHAGDEASTTLSIRAVRMSLTCARSAALSTLGRVLWSERGGHQAIRGCPRWRTAGRWVIKCRPAGGVDARSQQSIRSRQPVSQSVSQSMHDVRFCFSLLCWPPQSANQPRLSTTDCPLSTANLGYRASTSTTRSAALPCSTIHDTGCRVRSSHTSCQPLGGFPCLRTLATAVCPLHAMLHTGMSCGCCPPVCLVKRLVCFLAQRGR